MKILLLSPPYLPNYMRNARCDFVSLSGSQWYPILLGYCGAWLEEGGHEVKLIDGPAYGLSRKASEKLVKDYRPDWLVVYTGRLSETSDLELADTLTEEIGCRTVIVGPYASIDPAQTLSKSRSIELLVRGEFEFPVRELIEGKGKAETANLTYREEGEIVHNRERPYLGTDELDRIPFVSRFFNRHLEIDRYRTPSEPHPFIDIMTGRGCHWGRCTYCLWVNTYIRGPVYNCRSIANVIEELRTIAREMPRVKSVMLQDDTLTEERALEFCEAKIKAGIELPWSCYLRGNISSETLRTMKKAGCLNLHVGFESADPEILQRIKKGITRERMTRFAEDAKRAGLVIHGDFAIGFPGETEESVRKTVEWACRIRPQTAQFQLMIPFPGTPFYAELEEKGWFSGGAPNYPSLSRDRMEALSKRAYRKFYLSLPYLKEVLRRPRAMLFSRLDTYLKSLRSVLGGKYIR